MHRFDDSARMVFHHAREEALRLGHQRIAPEHLLLGVLHQEHPITKTLKELGLSLGVARNRLEELVGQREKLASTFVPEVSQAATACMEAAAAEARRLQAEQIGLGHVLLGVIRQAEMSTRQVTGGIAAAQVLGELEGGIRGVMRKVLEALRQPRVESQINQEESTVVCIKLMPVVYQKILEYARSQGVGIEAASQMILSDWAKR